MYPGALLVSQPVVTLSQCWDTRIPDCRSSPSKAFWEAGGITQSPKTAVGTSPLDVELLVAPPLPHLSALQPPDPPAHVLAPPGRRWHKEQAGKRTSPLPWSPGPAPSATELGTPWAGCPELCWPHTAPLPSVCFCALLWAMMGSGMPDELLRRSPKIS